MSNEESAKKDPEAQKTSISNPNVPLEDLSDMELEDVAGGVAADTISVSGGWSR